MSELTKKILQHNEHCFLACVGEYEALMSGHSDTEKAQLVYDLLGIINDTNRELKSLTITKNKYDELCEKLAWMHANNQQDSQTHN